MATRRCTCGKVTAVGDIHTCSPQVTAPTPERREVADLRDARISPEHLEALSRYARDEVSTGRLAELLGVSVADLADLRNAVQSDAPPAPEGNRTGEEA